MGNMLGTSAFPWNCHEPTIHCSKQKGSGTGRVIAKNACILVQIWYYVLMHGSHQPKLGIWYEIIKAVTMRNHSLSMKPLRTIFKPGCGMRADDSALAAFWLSRLVSLPVIGRLEVCGMRFTIWCPTLPRFVHDACFLNYNIPWLSLGLLVWEMSRG